MKIVRKFALRKTLDFSNQFLQFVNKNNARPPRTQLEKNNRKLIRMISQIKRKLTKIVQFNKSY